MEKAQGIGAGLKTNGFKCSRDYIVPMKGRTANAIECFAKVPQGVRFGDRASCRGANDNSFVFWEDDRTKHISTISLF
eukprot:7292539-Ditylum_brightwellii.AAC.1